MCASSTSRIICQPRDNHDFLPNLVSWYKLFQSFKCKDSHNKHFDTWHRSVDCWEGKFFIHLPANAALFTALVIFDSERNLNILEPKKYTNTQSVMLHFCEKWTYVPGIVQSLRWHSAIQYNTIFV